VVRRWVAEVWNEADAERCAASLHELHPAEILSEALQRLGVRLLPAYPAPA
jgi:hypothetical protein